MRYLYLWFLLAFAIMAYGFWPSVHGDFGPLDAIRWLHGLLAAGWMALLVVQTWLIGHGHWRWHRRFGRASRWLVPLLVASALVLVHDVIGPRSHFGPRLRLTLAALDTVSLLLFSGLYVAAIVHRRSVALHARYMAATVFVVLPPALGRAYGPLFGSLTAALQPAYWTVDAAMAAVIAWDAVHRRFLPPVPITLGATLLMQALAFHVPDIAPLVTLATWAGYRP